MGCYPNGKGQIWCSARKNDSATVEQEHEARVALPHDKPGELLQLATSKSDKDWTTHVSLFRRIDVEAVFKTDCVISTHQGLEVPSK